MAATQRVRGITCERVSKGRYRWSIGPHPWEWIDTDGDHLLTRYRVSVQAGTGPKWAWCLYDAVVYSQAYEDGRRDALRDAQG